MATISARTDPPQLEIDPLALHVLGLVGVQSRERTHRHEVLG